MQLKTMPLNEVGDFLAGVFGPLAVFWLILGFFQQGIELRQNTRALQLQVEELSKSVKHQDDLVAVARQQFQTEATALEEERVRREESYRPHFVFLGFGGSHSGAKSTMTFNAMNTGATVSEVSFLFSVPMRVVKPEKQALLRQNTSLSVEFEFQHDRFVDCDLHIIYFDGRGRTGSKKFSFSPDLTGEHPDLKVIRSKEEIEKVLSDLVDGNERG
jgi:hypothetical protein